MRPARSKIPSRYANASMFRKLTLTKNFSLNPSILHHNLAILKSGSIANMAITKTTTFD